MVPGPMNVVMRRLHRLASLPANGTRGDAELLERFIKHRDESAFGVLLERHGPMVLGVCRRALMRAQDVEDAFQAVFLVLVRKAAAIQPRCMVGNWLYGVACRVAMNAQKLNRRRGKEKQVDPMTAERSQTQAENWHDVQAVLDQELERLPDKYRAALVLCDIEGRSRKETARLLRVAEGTLSSRLATARKQLANRLRRRGITLSAGVLASLISNNLASAAVPDALVISTMEAVHVTAAGGVLTGAVSANVAILTQGVLQAMFMTKLKLALSFVLAVGILASGAGALVTHFAVARQPDARKDEPSQANPDPKVKIVQSDARIIKPDARKLPPGKEEARKPDAFVDLKAKLKKHQDEIAKQREAMLKLVDEEIGKLDEALKKGQDAARAGNKEASQRIGELTYQKRELLAMRFHIENGSYGRQARLPEVALDQLLGLQAASPNATLREQLGLAKDQGLIVEKVTANSPAARAGLKAHDVLMEVDGKKVPSDVASFRKMLRDVKAGAPVNATVLRHGKTETIQGLVIPGAAAAPTQLFVPGNKGTPGDADGN